MFLFSSCEVGTCFFGYLLSLMTLIIRFIGMNFSSLSSWALCIAHGPGEEEPAFERIVVVRTVSLSLSNTLSAVNSVIDWPEASSLRWGRSTPIHAFWGPVRATLDEWTHYASRRTVNKLSRRHTTRHFNNLHGDAAACDGRWAKDSDHRHLLTTPCLSVILFQTGPIWNELASSSQGLLTTEREVVSRVRWKISILEFCRG